MPPLDVAHRYFDAWNQRDPAAIVATFAPGGTYTDPIAGTLSGPAIGEYARALFEAFPDLQFEVVSAAPAGASAVAAQWLMKGTNRGPLQGAPPTGRTVAVPGADFIVVAGEAIQSVHGYFDTAATPRQLGLNVVVQPFTAGPFTFGTSTALHSGKSTTPGAFSLTVLEARSDEEVDQVSDYARRLAMAMGRLPGFLTLTTMVLGRRMYTITAWESVEAPRQLLRQPIHQEAMARFFAPDGVAHHGVTGVWQPHHLGPHWMRCEACQQMVAAEGESPHCRCGAALPAPPPYW